MSIEAHIDAIAEKREHIKEQIALESARPSPDFTVITRLKKQNLVLKEEMQQCFKMLKSSASQAS